MKKIVFATLAWMAVLPAHAQLFSRESLGGAAVGGVIGGIIGHNSGRRTAEGIGIGAGAGLILGALASDARRETYGVAPTPFVTGPVYTYYPARPNYAVTGAALGGLTGGIIGHNSGRRTAEGVAIGAGAGLVLGAVAEENARRQQSYLGPSATSVPVRAPATPPAAPAALSPQTTAPAPQPGPILNNSFTSPNSMSSANSLFGR